MKHKASIAVTYFDSEGNMLGYAVKTNAGFTLFRNNDNNQPEKIKTSSNPLSFDDIIYKTQFQKVSVNKPSKNVPKPASNTRAMSKPVKMF